MTTLALFRNISIVLLTIVMAHLVSLNASIAITLVTTAIGIVWIAGYRETFERFGNLCYIAYFAILVWLVLKGISSGYQVLGALCFLAAVDFDALFQRTRGTKKDISNMPKSIIVSKDLMKDNAAFLWSHTARFAIVLFVGLVLMAITLVVQGRVHYAVILITAIVVLISSSTIVYYLRQKNR